MAARIAIIELRCLLAADSFIGVSRRTSLVHLAAGLVEDTAKRELFVAQLTASISERFGRDPDTFEPSPQTRTALRLLNAVQEGRKW
ncbi:hypothetical protein ABGN05_16755 [Aquibium sp. LZ166]|uniref:Uncharacterized protein n=2 Tax=Aquibium pacificus TaxID=3153579 RepID=A0ABV3SKK4_9HYPH